MIALVVVALVLAAPAQADAPRNWERAALATAQRTWHPSCGALRLSFELAPNDAWAAWAWRDDCVIRVRADREWTSYPEFCDVVLHEGGHVTGRGHSDRGIMRAVRPIDVGYKRVRGRAPVKVFAGADRRCVKSSTGASRKAWR